MLRNVTLQMVKHPKTLAKILQELADRVSDLEAEVQPVKGAGKIRDKKSADREAKVEGKRIFQEAKAAEKAGKELAQKKAEAEEDSLAAAEQKRQDKINRSLERAATKNDAQKEGPK